MSKASPSCIRRWPPELQGSYAGLAHPAAIAHFKQLGVTTLSLLPVQYCVDEPHLRRERPAQLLGLQHPGISSRPIRAWRTAAHRHDPARQSAPSSGAMVAALQQALASRWCYDVVYNHTPEGNEYGPTLSFRGLRQPQLVPPPVGDDMEPLRKTSPAAATRSTPMHPRVTQFVLDSLRHWVSDMGVDGFRFDLAPVLGRTHHGFDTHAAFFAAMRQDPVLAGVHLIAEPWDAAYGGYQVGRFPGRFLEWNDKFRDAVRGYWLQSGQVGRGEFARRFTASSDVFHHGQRRPTASVNFVAVHDGYSPERRGHRYSHKHNQPNGEDNRDGRDGELCANFGAEGARPTMP